VLSKLYSKYLRKNTIDVGTRRNMIRHNLVIKRVQ